MLSVQTTMFFCFIAHWALCDNYPPLFSSFMRFLTDGSEHFYREPRDIDTPLGMYDFIVVGAGTAGCVVANRLSEVPHWKVLLLEAGREESFAMDIPILANILQFSVANWKYSTVPSKTACLGLKNKKCNIPRGKVMGGSSVLNYMIFNRGNKKDYTRWEELGNTGWGYEDVLPYFLKLENFKVNEKLPIDKDCHSHDGYMTVTDIPFKTEIAKAFVQAGIEIGFQHLDYNGRNQQGFGFHQVTMDNGTRMSSSKAYLHPARNRKNLSVMKYSQVTKVLINPITKQAYGVEFLRKRKIHRVKARREVILSAGAVNSPQLLMLSGVGPAHELNRHGIPVISDLPVGYNFMDHVALGGMTFLVDFPVSLHMDRLLNSASVLHQFMQYHKGWATIPGGTEAIGFIDIENPRDPAGYPDLELLLASGTMCSEPTLRASFGITDEIYRAVYKPIENKDGFMIFPMVLRPKSKGRIYLRNSNPLSPPMIDPRYFTDEADLDVLVQGVRYAKSMMNTTYFRKLGARLHRAAVPGCTHLIYDSDDYWKCHARHLTFTIYHQSGTCKMGPLEDPTAVLDPRLRVKGISRLRVVDASMFPEIPAAHPNGVILMVAEKAGDLIKQDWGL